VVFEEDKCFLRFNGKKRVTSKDLEELNENLELEIQQLKVSLSLLKDFKDEEDEDLVKKVHALQMDLCDKEELLEGLKDFTHLMINDRLVYFFGSWAGKFLFLLFLL